MSSTLFTEYRCRCGKLLFKGLLHHALVEVKCRRCGEIIIHGYEPGEYAYIECDTNGHVVHASGDIQGTFGVSIAYALDHSLADIPALRDMPRSSKNAGYALKDTVLALQDGGKPVQTCIVSCYQDGCLAGYRIFSKRTQRQELIIKR